ncbi:hypothetical protein PPL_02807 [Heterostelium album PN500]|uniref:Uncharacterized protein n=1 Tax=Heterostelium pallidum (strain ATCC 26659 / Pp 5 / PN500) TaxID=670386 RepID=D3B342_HETP5|nr:hypothetical protein PPL_02807 [Heterostelium album PN500]EFA83740.1 hypothetical protein PPL_02807 [Heterostelium album PN500]|eukprot:XP_020435857.1 hypothetical protein PPL_02807 [Heterostelium album PN500]
MYRYSSLNKIYNSSSSSSSISRCILNCSGSDQLLQQQCSKRYMSFWSYLNPFKYYKTTADTPQKKKIQYELKEGISWDYKEMLKNPNMKLFLGTQKAIPLGQSITCPPITSVDLYGNNVNIPKDFPASTPVLLVVTLKPFLGQQFVDSWIAPFKEKYPDLPVHHVVLIQQTGYKLLAPLLKPSRRSTSAGITESWSNQAIYIKDVNQTLQELTITNPLGAYIYLVMDNKIRWKSSGRSTAEELDYLTKVTNTLMTTPNPLAKND